MNKMHTTLERELCFLSQRVDGISRICILSQERRPSPGPIRSIRGALFALSSTTKNGCLGSHGLSIGLYWLILA